MMDPFGGMAVLAALGAISLLFAVVGLVFYILKSIALMTMASKRGIDNPWLGWIPIAALYIMGSLVGEMDILDFHLDNLGLWCPIIIVGGSLLSGIPFLGAISGIALLIFAIMFTHKLFSLYAPQEAVLYTILSILLLLLPVFLFIVRNKECALEADQIRQPPAC
jgi:hypothetical protein